MRIKDVMTTGSLKYCTPETNLHNAAESMREANCGVLPVVDKNKKVLGIVTDRDICLSLARNSPQALEKRTIGEIMTHDVKTVRSNEDVSEAFRKMREKKVSRLPVVDEKGSLQGIVSLNKLLNATIVKGRDELGTIYDSGENLLKTLHAISTRREAKLPLAF